MALLTRTEEIVLLAVYQLGDEAYGVTIRKQIEDAIGMQFSVGAIYVPLERLGKRGFVTTTMSEPIPERGGRSKRYYQITPAGIRALQEVRQLQEALWAGVPNLAAPRLGRLEKSSS